MAPARQRLVLAGRWLHLGAAQRNRQLEGLEEVRQLVESTRNLRLPLLDEFLVHPPPLQGGLPR